MRRSLALVATIACAAALPALAVESCDVAGQHVNPANGYTTAGKTGLMRCRDGEGGPVVREQELQNGVFMGVVRYFRDGQLEKEHRVASPQARGREVATGVHRSFDESGRLRSERFHDERGRVARERELDASGTVVRDDEVFEDGSRKAYIQ